MKRTPRILLAIVLVLTSIVVYQQKQELDTVTYRLESSIQSCNQALNHNLDEINSLYMTVTELHSDLDLSVLDSCGVITNGRGFGSCVAIRPNLILTAGHCVDIPDTWIEIGGTKYNIKNKWRSSNYDVGVVVIDANLPCLELGDNPSILDEIYIIGTPRNFAFINKISKGIICKINIEYKDTIVNWTGDFLCDAMAWGGNSGGPVLYPCGKICGIYVGLFRGSDNFSICVPVGQIKAALEEYNVSTSR